MIKVKASREGYYKNQIRDVGEIFEIESEEELGAWMDVIEEPKEKAEVPSDIVPPADAETDVQVPVANAISDLI